MSGRVLGGQRAFIAAARTITGWRTEQENKRAGVTVTNKGRSALAGHGGWSCPQEHTAPQLLQSLPSHHPAGNSLISLNGLEVVMLALKYKTLGKYKTKGGLQSIGDGL